MKEKLLYGTIQWDRVLAPIGWVCRCGQGQASYLMRNSTTVTCSLCSAVYRVWGRVNLSKVPSEVDPWNQDGVNEDGFESWKEEEDAELASLTGVDQWGN